jgi:hypothetical protein
MPFSGPFLHCSTSSIISKAVSSRILRVIRHSKTSLSHKLTFHFPLISSKHLLNVDSSLNNLFSKCKVPIMLFHHTLQPGESLASRSLLI